MSQYKVSNGHMAYEDHGKAGGLPIVLLHAFPLNGQMWEPQIEALKSGYRIITPDYPGFGRSSRPCAGPDIRYYAEGMRELLERLELEKVVIGGLSMGGYVALSCYRLFPEKISALILANTRADQDSEELRENRRSLARRVAEEGVGILPEVQMERLLAEGTLKNNPEVVEKVKNMILASSPDGVLGALGAIADRPDSISLLSNIQVPALVISGEHDTLSTPAIMSAMAQKLPNARHTVLSSAGHLSSLENPGAFNAELKKFLGSL